MMYFQAWFDIVVESRAQEQMYLEEYVGTKRINSN
jgi:hypothetical protein